MNSQDKKTEILIIGAGAAGLMAARELAKAGKKVVILEARDRIGGRIMPLSESQFGFPAEGGAEFVHGEAPITKSLMKEAGWTLVPEEGEIWSVRGGELSVLKFFVQENEELKKKLDGLKEDISIADFLEQNLDPEKDVELKNSIIKMVNGYDAADPNLVSSFMIRDSWFGKEQLEDGRIKEGYGALLNFLESECKKYGVEIYLNTRVESINIEQVLAATDSGETYEAEKILITVPLPIIKEIKFDPEIKIVEKLKLVDQIGFGGVIKTIIKFQTRWWENALGKDLSKMYFLITNEKFLTWWTPSLQMKTVLVGWMAGPEVLKYKDASSEELLDIALASLSNVFKIDKDVLAKEVATYEVINWSTDPFARGAYSYTTFYTKDAREKLAEPIDNKIFFAGEALYSGEETSMVEGALGSGLEATNKILST